MGVSHACIGWDKGIKTCSSKLCGGPCRCKLLCKGPLVKEPVCRGEWTTSVWEHPLCQSTHACERAHVCINTHACTHTHTHTHTQGMFAFFPSPPQPLLQWLTCSFIQPSTNSGTMVTAAEMFFPRETDNIEITTPLTTQPTTRTHPPLSPRILSFTHPPVCRVWRSLPCKGKLLELAVSQNSLAGVCALPAPAPWLCPGSALVFLLEKPSRRGEEPCGSRTRVSGTLLAQNRHLQRQD